MGLDNPLGKMSKSEASEYHAVYLLDPPDVARKKIMRATTDSNRDIRFSSDPERAGVNNLLTIYQALTGQSRETIEASFESARGYGDLKKTVADAVVDRLTPLQARYGELMGESGYLDEILAEGAARARAVADATLATARERVGLIPAFAPVKG